MRPARRSSVPPIPWSAWRDSVGALTEAGQFSDAARTIERALNEGHDPAQLLELLEAVEGAAPTSLPRVACGALSLEALRLRVRLTGNTGDAPAVIRLIQQAQRSGLNDPALHGHLAWALTQQEQFLEALRAAERALHGRAQLTPREVGLALRMKGFALNRLNFGQDGRAEQEATEHWAALFEEALTLSEGWARGLILLDLAGLYSRAGQDGQAMMAYAEALTLVVSPGHRAMMLNNMGLICLRQGRFAEAESYYMQVTRLRSGYRSRALAGQAAARRALGEWARAEHLYREAEKEASDTDDLRQARRGLGHTLRLAGQVMKALEVLQDAAQTTPADRDSGRSWVNVDLAAALVSLRNPNEAAVRQALSRTGPLDQEDAERAVIVHAELARLNGDDAQALGLIGPLASTSLWVREEAHAFPRLFALLPPTRRPEPLPRPAQAHVHLRALGPGEVTVNGRRIRLAPLELLLLTALILEGGSLTTEALTDVLRDERPRDARRAAQRVSVVVRQVRAALGWPTSIVAERGLYRLDPETRWTSDLHGAAAADATEFLRGIHLPWVIEQEQILIHRDSDNLT